MKPFRFCPACGSHLDSAGEEEGRRCESCDRSWYLNMAPTVGAAIVKEGRALATVRAREPEKGKLDVPGGFLGAQEDPLEGLRREVREELGITVELDLGDCISMTPHRYGAEGDPVLAIGFRARWTGGTCRPADDVAGIRWVASEELDSLDFAWPHDRELLRKALGHG